MTQLFHKAANPLSKACIVGGIFIVAFSIYAFDLLYKSPYVDEKQVIRQQPVPFSHKHHVADLGIDCRYCHVSVENSAFAGIPPVSTCMTCHSQIWKESRMLEPVRHAYETGQPLKWVRVNKLPDYVYFDHGIHVSKGVACVTCHGPVGDMPLTWREGSLQMRWCLSCHEHPEKFVRSRDVVFQTDPQAPSSQADLVRWLDQIVGQETGPVGVSRGGEAMGRRLVLENHIQKLTDCATCHR
jgi:hypothetical protein